MRIEVKGLIAAVIAGAAVIGAAYGVSVLIVGAHGSGGGHKASAPPSRAAPKAGASVANPALVAQGHEFYTQSCASCHGAGGVGGYGPVLRHEDMTDAQIALKIKNGAKRRMPAFGHKYNDQQTYALVAYVRSLK